MLDILFLSGWMCPRAGVTGGSMRLRFRICRNRRRLGDQGLRAGRSRLADPLGGTALRHGRRKYETSIARPVTIVNRATYRAPQPQGERSIGIYGRHRKTGERHAGAKMGRGSRSPPPDPQPAAEAEPEAAAPQASGPFAAVADRLQEIADALRADPGAFLSGAQGGGDPLALLVAGFVLGYNARRGGGS
jgi:hypothetical protein